MGRDRSNKQRAQQRRSLDGKAKKQGLPPGRTAPKNQKRKYLMEGGRGENRKIQGNGSGRIERKKEKRERKKEEGKKKKR
ncbi:hypothetical protein P168DRAFT_94288 [Aspergillus campestris IBT 28561]|uniref:Uncharacterized protein n=1 Tax=Aspergillus campestris (strain IBT 28561) TaxID=1392248 RepID=A0A2I1DBU3_ASPC2|nr:uncharacterized protein P168DRAFT_94288 [Aspergillus campestris IBT 28561]PKY07355.1 hypothetical protein P168DRAFT_94288 [Aspergillus campestris IBT 28561]